MQESDSVIIFIVGSLAGVAGAVSAVVCLVLGIVFYSGFSVAELPSAPSVVQEEADALPAALPAFNEAAPSGSTDTDALDAMNSVGQAKSSAEAEQSSAAPGLSDDINAAIETYLQYPALPGGCEVVSMTAVLRALGNDISATDFADRFVLQVSGEPYMVNSYSGSPYKNGAAFPPVMVRAGNDYLRERHSQYRFAERSNTSLEKLMQIIETGRPVLVWTTMYMSSPTFTGDVIAGYQWYNNEHCVVLYGQNAEGNLLVMDPLEGAVVRDRAAFEDIYNACGRHAVTLTGVAAEAIDARETAE